MIRALVASLFLAFAPLAHAEYLYDDVTDAANDALTKAYYTCSHRTECGGFIIQVGNHYVIVDPVSSGKAFANPAMGDLYAEVEKHHFHIVADYHTHVCSPHNVKFSPFFSPADVDTNDGLHTVGYMLSLCDDMIRMYRPSIDDRDDEEVDFMSGKKIYLTIGHVVGYVPGEVCHEKDLVKDHC